MFFFDQSHVSVCARIKRLPTFRTAEDEPGCVMSCSFGVQHTSCVDDDYDGCFCPPAPTLAGQLDVQHDGWCVCAQSVAVY